jgi:hypothetical protein
MIPVKGCTYLIQYLNFEEPDSSYYGTGVYTGEVEEDSDEEDLTKGFLYEFINLKTESKHTSKRGLFAAQDILKKVNI